MIFNLFHFYFSSGLFSGCVIDVVRVFAFVFLLVNFRQMRDSIFFFSLLCTVNVSVCIF